MLNPFDENRLADKRDSVGAPDQDFDWKRLYERLSEDAETGDNDPKLSETVVRILQMLLPPLTNHRIQPQSLGMRLIALAWVLSPGYFEGSPSITKLARRCGVRIAALANYTGYYSRLLGWRNRGQRHAWNWRRDRTPSHRGQASKSKSMRNVQHLSKAAASGGKSASAKRPGGVRPLTKSKRKRSVTFNV